MIGHRPPPWQYDSQSTEDRIFLTVFGCIHMNLNKNGQNYKRLRWKTFLNTSWSSPSKRRFSIDGTLMGDQLLINEMPEIIRSYNYIGDALNTFRYGESQSYLDDLKFFNKSLSINEIKQLMNSSGSLILKL